MENICIFLELPSGFNVYLVPKDWVEKNDIEINSELSVESFTKQQLNELMKFPIASGIMIRNFDLF